MPMLVNFWTALLDFCPHVRCGRRRRCRLLGAESALGLRYSDCARRVQLRHDVGEQK